MNCHQTNRQKGLVLAVVAVLLAVTLTACVGSVSAVNDTSHEVEMRTGDEFSYTPTTNLDAAISISGTATSFLSLASGTISGSPDTAGEYTLVVTATWTSSINTSVSQTSTQTITITVYDRISLDSTTATVVYVLGLDTGGISYTLDYDGPSGTTVEWTSNVPGLASSGTGATVSGTPTSTGTYTVVYTLSFESSSGDVADTATFTLYVAVTDNIAVTSDLEDATYVGASWSYTAASNASTVGATGVTWSISGVTKNGTATTASAAGISIGSSTGVVSGTFSSVTGYDSDGTYDLYVITLGVSGTYSNNGVSETVSATADLTLYVYAELEFTTTPTSKVTVTPSETSSMVAELTVTTTGATEVTVEWGDGSYTTATTAEEIEELVNGLSHAYAADGIYTIVVTATNSAGDVVTTIVYDTSDGSSWISTSAEEASSIVSDYSLVIVLLLICAVLVAVGYLYSPYGYYGALAVLLIAVACLLLGATGFGDL